jgi:hypothetical protein
MYGKEGKESEKRQRVFVMSLRKKQVASLSLEWILADFKI